MLCSGGKITKAKEETKEKAKEEENIKQQEK